MLAALILLPIDVGVRRVVIVREQLALGRAWIQARLRRASSATVDSVATVSIAKLKGARSRVVLGDPKADGPRNISPVSQPPDRASKSTDSGETVEGAETLASRLLDAKRKRRE